MDSEPVDMNCLHPNPNSNRRPLRCRGGLQTRVRQSSSPASLPYHFNPCGLTEPQTFRHTCLPVPPRPFLQKEMSIHKVIQK